MEGNLPQLPSNLTPSQLGSSQNPDLKTGQIIGGKVTGKSNQPGTTVVELQGQNRTATVKLQANIPPNSILIGKVTGQQPTTIEWMNGPREVRNLSTTDLKAKLRQLNLPTSDRAVQRATNQLKTLGYILPDRLPGQQSQSGNMNQLMNQLQTILPEPLSDNQQATLLETLRGSIKPNIQNVDVLSGVADQLSGSQRQQVNQLLQAIQSQLKSSNQVNQLMNQLQTLLPEPLSDDQQSQLLQTLRKPTEAKLQSIEVLSNLSDQLSNPRRQQINQVLQALQNQLRMSGDRDARSPGNWLQSLNLPETIRTREVVQQLIRANIQPDRQRVETLLEFIRSNPTQSKPDQPLNQTLALLQNGAPKSAEMVELLSRNLTDQARPTSESQIQPGNLPTRTDEVRQTLQRLSGDLVQNMKSNQSIDFSLLFRLFQKQSGNQQDGNDRFWNQVLRHLVASSMSDDKVFMLFPFKLDGETHFAQLRFRDDRESGGEGSTDQWSLSIRLELTNLGAVEINLTHRPAKLTLDFEAEQAHTVELLRRNRDQLKDRLEQMGYASAIRARTVSDSGGDLIQRNLGTLSDPVRPSFDTRA